MAAALGGVSLEDLSAALHERTPAVMKLGVREGLCQGLGLAYQRRRMSERPCTNCAPEMAWLGVAGMAAHWVCLACHAMEPVQAGSAWPHLPSPGLPGFAVSNAEVCPLIQQELCELLDICMVETLLILLH